MKAIFLAGIFLLFASQSHANWKKEILSYADGNQTSLKATKLDYTMSWNGAIDAGKLTIEFGKKDARYPNIFLTHSYGRATGAAYMAFPYVVSMTSFAQAKTYRPLVFVANEKDRKETIDTKNSFKSPGIHHYSKTIESKNKEEHVKDRSFAAKAVHDPITAMLAIRKQPLKNGDSIKLCCHPFASPYLIAVTVLGREKHLNQDCIKLDIKIQKIDRKTGELKQYKKMKKFVFFYYTSI